ncbi:hypothetical protein [Thiobacillus sp.]|uniref:hypothetical protein n=1 Tax=Thiobacillus sp. TaxID=924 RepID=UPI0018180FAC|nr:hypothetical protein [Thiobacillus sp.]MBC2732438.1 hypothetical protein [Thiobacillus sp.]MBC2741176.1 hypothetical protein [Thiobacillus sp.]MBC2759867.1 hypothetical protein [Thiobacillus sp.]
MPNIRVKGYGGTWGIVLLIIIYAYIGRPIEPGMPVVSELHEVVGQPVYRQSLATKSAVGLDYFAVNGLRLDCNFGLMGGSGGCGFFNQVIDLKKPVHATYFWMPTRLGYDYRMLHALEQEGRLIVSPQQTYAVYARLYKASWKTYYQLLLFGFIVIIIMWLIERSNARNKACRAKGAPAMRNVARLSDYFNCKEQKEISR